MASLPTTIVLGSTPHDRRAIERRIEELIDLLDRVDGDCDLEDDELHEDELDLGEANVLGNPAPVYGVDQTGPVLAWTNPRPRIGDN